MDYDFALIKVSDPFPVGQKGIESIKLTKIRPNEDTLVTVSGWGALHVGFWTCYKEMVIKLYLFAVWWHCITDSFDGRERFCHRPG